MNGKNTLVSNAARWAANRGIICVISAGNEGSGAWKYITAPADADSIISVGAVDRTGLRASFSSQGPSFDKRIKPDVSAMGLGTIAGLPNGQISSLNGTSFSAPLIAGLAAGLIQSSPNKNNFQIINAIRKSSSLADKPDNLVGFGVPNFDRAFFILNPVLSTEELPDTQVRLFPNPLKTGEKLTIELDDTKSAQVEICNSQGAIVLKFPLKSQREELNLPPLAAGKYFVRLYVGNQQKVIPLLFN
jgi:subtilisin family serine protease